MIAQPERSSVLFVCVHNAGRSQMAAAFVHAMSGGGIEVRSAGSDPADRLNPVVVEVMREAGIDLAGEQPTRLTNDAVQASDVVVTMGCGDACPVFPGTRYEDWAVADPAGADRDTVRAIRDDIRARTQRLVADLLPN
ncbi:MAG: arsenate reductase ArsC [Actinomycetota bacterium]|nr:arsenate reductase ArsC [Actinomycetota bacterium]